MKKILFVLIIAFFTSCNNDYKIVTNKVKTGKKYYLQLHKVVIYVDSLEFYKKIKLGNNGNILDSKYYLVFGNINKTLKVSEYRYTTTQIGDTIK